MMMRRAGLLATTALAGFALHAAPADEEPEQMPDVVVTATLQETEAEKLGQSVTLISREELDASKLTYVKDYLRRVPGLNLRSNGPNGNSSVSIRGLQPYHTKLLIDGMAYQDATSPQVLPVLNTLRVEDIERIEVVRGPSSTVNGSNAIGGVINIVTRKGKDGDGPVSGSVGVEFGGEGRQLYSGALRGVVGPVDYSFSASWLAEDGISAQTGTAALDDDDSYRNASFSGRAGMDLGEHLRLELFGRFSDADVEFDALAPDTADCHQQDWLAGGRLSATDLLDGFLDSSVSLSVSELRRAYRNEGFDWNAGDRFIGQTIELGWLNTIHLAEGYDFTVGINSTSESADTLDGGFAAIEERHRTVAYLAELQASPINNLFLTAGVRYNEHSVFGDETTWSVAGRYFVETTGTTFKAAAGKAYRAPSLYELYDAFSGNAALEPETNQSWEVGFEQALCENKVTFGATYYESRISNYIDYVSLYDSSFNWIGGGYEQVSGMKAHGIESFARYRPWDCLSLQATHTYQHTNNMGLDVAPVAYRPSHMASLGVTYTGCDDRLTVDLTGNYVGSRRSWHGNGGTKLESYCLMGLGVSFDLTDNLEIYGRIENLLNDGYETNLGYGTYGRCYYAGLKLAF